MKFVLKIKKGRHYHSNWLHRFLFLRLKKSQIKENYMDVTCWYDESEQEFTGWNKLGGVCGLLPHKYSARIAWKPAKKYGMFKLAGYVYSNGERTIKEFAEVMSNTWFVREIHPVEGGWNFTINNKSIYMKAKRRPSWNKLSFYFGGREKAPHKMYIKEK